MKTVYVIELHRLGHSILYLTRLGRASPRATDARSFSCHAGAEVHRQKLNILWRESAKVERRIIPEADGGGADGDGCGAEDEEGGED